MPRTFQLKCRLQLNFFRFFLHFVFLAPKKLEYLAQYEVSAAAAAVDGVFHAYFR